MRKRSDVQKELARLEALVWYSRHRQLANEPTCPTPHAHARAVEAEYADALTKVDLDEGWQVARLEGQLAALRWLTAEPGPFDELSTYGELYDT